MTPEAPDAADAAGAAAATAAAADAAGRAAVADAALRASAAEAAGGGVLLLLFVTNKRRYVGVWVGWGCCRIVRENGGWKLGGLIALRLIVPTLIIYKSKFIMSLAKKNVACKEN